MPPGNEGAAEKPLGRRVAGAMIPPLAAGLIRLLHSTLRIRYSNFGRMDELNQRGERFVMAFWHSHLLLMAYARFAMPMTALISRSEDGELIAQTLARFGISAARGSSSRGGAAALREMIRAGAAGSNLGISPDGPRGPNRIAQMGVILAAQATQLPILPVAIIAKKKKLLRSWDRFEVAFPFTQILFLYGEPFLIPRRLTSEEAEAWRAEVERRLNALSDEGTSNFDTIYEGAEEQR